MPSRRQVLAGVTAASTAGFAGCNDLLQSETREGEGDTIEIIVTNRMDQSALIGVRVEERGGGALFSRVYRLEPGTTDESAGIDTTPAIIRVFTPSGTAAEWEYRPDPDLNCAGKDIGIVLAADESFESWYGC